MTSKSEQLIEDMVYDVGSLYGDRQAKEKLCAIAEVAHAEGVAEGEKQERERARVLSEKLYGPIVVVHNIYGSDFNVEGNERGYYAVGDNGESGESHSSVLAPTKK